MGGRDTDRRERKREPGVDSWTAAAGKAGQGGRKTTRRGQYLETRAGEKSLEQRWLVPKARQVDHAEACGAWEQMTQRSWGHFTSQRRLQEIQPLPLVSSREASTSGVPMENRSP